MGKVSKTIILSIICFLALFSFWTRAEVVVCIQDQLAKSLVLRQNFDDETAGSVPKNWSVTMKYGSFSVDNTVYYGKSGKSAKIVDNSIEGSPNPYRNFIEQAGTIVVIFAIRMTNNTGKNTNLEVCVDDGKSAGANIIFKEDGTIRYRESNGQLIRLRNSYLPSRWYRVKMIMNIPDNVYNIHIDDHLEAINANFTGVCDQIKRIIIKETSPDWKPIAHIDDIEVRKCIEVPKDFPTIQEGIDGANPGDVVFVAKERVYFENVEIKKDVWLVGEEMTTTIIDGHFMKTESRESNGISLIQCRNVTICGFTVRNAEANGIYVEGGSNNTVANNILISSLNHGIYIFSSNSTVKSNVIESNDDCGIYMNGSNNSIRKNILRNNGIGIKCDVHTKGNIIYQNRFICNTLQALDLESNIWDNSYPYKPEVERGGGNYWSNYRCADIRSGVDQDEHGPYCSPLPDGICDKPYKVSAHSQDNYPLFLIQSVSQKPENASRIYYTTRVNVTATFLTDVQVEEAKIYVSFDSQFEVVPMKMYGNLFNGTIPLKPYSTKVRYSISVRPYCALPINSTDYPSASPYYVQDLLPPSIGTIRFVPSKPNENQTISVFAIVTEPKNASQVDKVFLVYDVSGSLWKTEMTKTTGDEYKAIMPKQPGRQRLNITVEAFDKAGNKASPKPASVYINELAELSLTYKDENVGDPCNIDLGVMSKNEAKDDDNLKIRNVGQVTLQWEIIAVKTTPWFSTNITAGPHTTDPEKYTPIKIKINTKDYTDPIPCVGEFLIRANGTVPEWTIIVRVMVMHIVIDSSWASSATPNRCNVNSLQNYAFHSTWAHNSSDAISGNITITEIGSQANNRTGWASFTYSSSNPIKKIFKVEKVRFPCTYNGKVYYITSFTQKVPSISTIWDRVNIILNITDNRIDVCSEADVSWHTSVYEYDKSTFEGSISFNDTLHHDIVGKWCITISSIVDLKYNLTAFKSNTVCCIWDRIKIIGGSVSQSQANIGQTKIVWFTAIYEYDNQLFKGTNGKLFLDVSENTHVVITNDPMNWSSEMDIWKSNYLFKTLGTRAFKVSNVFDELYNLTKIKDEVGPLSIAWGTKTGILSISLVWPLVISAMLGVCTTIILLFWILQNRRTHG